MISDGNILRLLYFLFLILSSWSSIPCPSFNHTMANFDFLDCNIYLNSPNTSVIAIDSIPPPSSLFSSLDPVVTLNTFFLRTDCWRAVQNPALVPQIFKIPSLILSTLASDSPTHLEILKIRAYFFPIKMKEKNLKNNIR